MSSPPQSQSAIADPPLGGDRELALQHMPERFRPAVDALFRLDAAMGDVVARSTDPVLGRIKLAWWRESLERLDGAPAPAEPRLRAVEDHLLPLGVTGVALAALEGGWATLLDEEVEPRLVARHGSELFILVGKIIGQTDEKLADAGALYALVSIGRRGVSELLDHAVPIADRLRGHRFRRSLRPLTGLACLAARDLRRRDPFEAEGGPARAFAMLKHRWSGVVTRAH
jgi:phytoene synthase